MRTTLACLFLSLLFLGCEGKKTIRPGIQTKLSGKITDYFNAPLVNGKLKVAEFKSDHNTYDESEYFQQWIDSTYTNSNGEYDFDFRSTGLGTSYKLYLENPPSDNPKFWGDIGGMVDITNIGGRFIFNANYIALVYPCDITFTVAGVTDFPLSLYHDTTHIINNNNQITSNTTTVKRIYIVKYHPQKVSIIRTKADGTRQEAAYTFPASNVETLTTQNITVNDADFVNI